jgi:hypothetical protein
VVNDAAVSAASESNSTVVTPGYTPEMTFCVIRTYFDRNPRFDKRRRKRRAWIGWNRVSSREGALLEKADYGVPMV